jgi:DNA-binding NarL/FixJ family response regulator
MIKLTVTCTDKASEAQLLKRLRGEKDIRVKGSIVIRNVVREIDKVLAFIDKMVKSPPDVIILDVAILREAAALDLPLVLEYARKFALTRVIIVGDRFHEQKVITMMEGGARGFLLREHFDADIIKCIRVVARGEIWLSAGLVGRVFDELLRECRKRQQLKPPTSHQLAVMKDISRREMEILSYISESMTNDEIAQKLFLSAKTVKTHIRNIFGKTGIRNRVEAALLYTRFKQDARN